MVCLLSDFRPASSTVQPTVPRQAAATARQGRNLTSPRFRGASWRTGLVDQILGQWLRGKPVNARTSAFASSISGPILGNAAASWWRTLSQVAATVSASGWAKMVRNTAATMSLCDMGTSASRLRTKCTRQR